jgi:hypothetical protein
MLKIISSFSLFILAASVLAGVFFSTPAFSVSVEAQRGNDRGSGSSNEESNEEDTGDSDTETTGRGEGVKQIEAGFCDDVAIEIKWWKIIQPGAFLPLVPEDCAQNADGTPKALPISLIADVMIRGYGFLVSLGFYLIFPVILFAGLQYMIGGISESQTAASIKLLQNAFIGLIMLVSFYMIVYLVLGLLGFDTATTDLDNFY